MAKVAGNGHRQLMTPSSFEQLMARAASGATYGVIGVMRSGAGRIRAAPKPADVCFGTFVAANSSFSLLYFLHFYCIFCTSMRKFGEGEIFRIDLFLFFCYCCFLTALFQATKATFGATYGPFMLVAATQLITPPGTGTAATFAIRHFAIMAAWPWQHGSMAACGQSCPTPYKQYKPLPSTFHQIIIGRLVLIPQIMLQNRKY